MSDDKLHDAIQKGARADALLRNETFQEAIEAVKSGLIESWKLSKTVEDRERIWLSVHLVEQVKKAIVAASDNGKISRVQLTQLIQS